MSVSKYINVDAMDTNGDGYRFSIHVTEDNVLSVIKTIVNRTCLVIDAWGYGEYGDMYDYRMPIIDATLETGSRIKLEFAGVIDFLDLDISDRPRWDDDTYTLEYGLSAWDEILLEGYEYDPDTEPYDLCVIISELGVPKFEYAGGNE